MVWTEQDIRERATRFFEQFGIDGWRLDTYVQNVFEMLQDDGDVEIQWEEDPREEAYTNSERNPTLR